MRIRLFDFICAAGLVFVCAHITASAQEKTGAKRGFTLKPGTARIILMHPTIRAGSQSTGGLREPNADWTAQAIANIGTALRTAQARLGNEVIFYDEGLTGEGQIITQYGNLFGAVADSVIEYQFFPGNRLPTKKHAQDFDWGIGPGLGQLKSLRGADYALFINTRDDYGSTGRKMLQVAGLLAGVAVTSGVHLGYAGLVDLKSGAVVWLNADRQMGGDVRTPDGAAKRVDQLLEGFPGRPTPHPQTACIEMLARILGALFVVAGMALGIDTAQAATTARDSLPPFTAGYEPTNVDERGLWMESDERERQLRDSALTLRDETLRQYLHGILCRTVGAERCRSVRIYIMEYPGFNANMAPNGSMVVWTGLLLRTQNEAEVAAVLGHEFAHFELRHSLNGFKQRRAATDVAAWAAVWGGLANTNTRNLQYAMIGSIYRFSREQEQAADLLGFKYLAAANYPTNAAPSLWKHLMAEDDATAIGHGHKPQQTYNAGFFNTHPSSLKRATYLAAESQKIGDSGRDARADALAAAIAPHLSQWLDAQVRLNDFGGSEFLLQQRALTSGWTAELLFARGELYRLRGRPRDLITSAEFYRDALAKGYAKPEVHRNLGMALMRSGEQAQAAIALRAYLRLSPDASDAKAVMALLGQ